jgi:hypothetical protein
VTNKLLSTDLWVREFVRMYREQEHSPLMKLMRERAKRDWEALSPTERLKRRLVFYTRELRIKLAEAIAGQRFGDY